MATYLDGTVRRATSNTVKAARHSAEMRRCPKCQRKGALIRFSNEDAYGTVCRWKNCDYTDRILRDSSTRTTTTLKPNLSWDQVLPGAVIIYRRSGTNTPRTMQVTECHDTGNPEVKQVVGVLVSARDAIPLGPRLNNSRRRPGERREILHVSMVRSITPAAKEEST